MSNLPQIGIIDAAFRGAGNQVCGAIGKGYGTFARALCAIDPNATYETPPVAWCYQDMSAQDADVPMWNALRLGDLPQLASGSWGEDGIIAEADAVEAMQHSRVYAAGGLADEEDPRAVGERPPKPSEWRALVFEAEGLQLVPEPEP